MKLDLPKPRMTTLEVRDQFSREIDCARGLVVAVRGLGCDCEGEQEGVAMLAGAHVSGWRRSAPGSRISSGSRRGGGARRDWRREIMKAAPRTQVTSAPARGRFTDPAPGLPSSERRRGLRRTAHAV
jgi:hypothetical protein